MNSKDTTAFLFDISNEVKHFYETPVIFVTKKDYAEIIFDTMCTIRSILQGDNSDRNIIDTIVEFHLQWVHAVNEIENFQKRMQDLTRDEMYQAISYTIDAMTYRLKYFQRYMDNNRKTLNNLEQSNLQSEMEIVEDMHKHIIQNLLNQLKCFRNFSDDVEFKVKVKYTVEVLLQWLDKINDGLAMLLSKYINVNVPHLSGDLTKTLQQIVEDLQDSESPTANKLLTEMKETGRQIGEMIRCTDGHDLEISKVVEKVNILEDRIKRLGNEPTSAALMALQNKKDYLEKRLASLEQLKTTIKQIQDRTEVQLENINEEEICICEDFFQLRIFNSSLPEAERERLVTELCFLWDLAVFGEKTHKSIISILSAADMKEEYEDELGTFYIDEYSRKIYKLPDDKTLYQPNELNELVPVSDDAEHIYFYDECGRYFIDSKTRQRVYKAHSTASEYMMDSSGALLKVKEERDGMTYFYDNYGRYYVNSDGKHVYREIDSVSEYENDGLGNLVRIRSHLDIFDPCPAEANVTEEFKYLKNNVGTALRHCIAEVVMHQPADPIKYLSLCLLKYRENIELRDKRAKEKEELLAEREIKIAEERERAERAAKEAALLLMNEGGSEASYDSNMIKYTTMDPESFASSPK